MTYKLNPIKTKKLIKLVLSYGWKQKKRKGGSHLVFVKHPPSPRPIVIFDNKKEAPVYVIKEVIEHLGITIEEYFERIKQV